MLSLIIRFPQSYHMPACQQIQKTCSMTVKCICDNKLLHINVDVCLGDVFLVLSSVW